MLKPDFNNLDGEVVGYDIPSAIVPPHMNAFDQDNFYPADGLLKKGGVRQELQRRRSLREKKGAQRQERRNLRTSSTASARTNRSQAKLGQSEAQKIASAGLANSSSTNQVISSDLPPANTGLSKNAKIGIGIGVGVLVLGVIYFMTKGSKSSGK